MNHLWTCRCTRSYTKPFERACAICLPELERKWGANFARVMPSGEWSKHERPVWDNTWELGDERGLTSPSMKIVHEPCMSYKLEEGR